jgi:hypothetical protein
MFTRTLLGRGIFFELRPNIIGLDYIIYFVLNGNEHVHILR